MDSKTSRREVGVRDCQISIETLCSSLKEWTWEGTIFGLIHPPKTTLWVGPGPLQYRLCYTSFSTKPSDQHPPSRCGLALPRQDKSLCIIRGRSTRISTTLGTPGFHPFYHEARDRTSRLHTLATLNTLQTCPKTNDGSSHLSSRYPFSWWVLEYGVIGGSWL